MSAMEYNDAEERAMDNEQRIPLSVREAAMSSPVIHAHLTLYLRGDLSLEAALRGAYDALVVRMTDYAKAVGLPPPVAPSWPDRQTTDAEVAALLCAHNLAQVCQREAERQIAQSTPSITVLHPASVVDPAAIAGLPIAARRPEDALGAEVRRALERRG